MSIAIRPAVARDVLLFCPSVPVRCIAIAGEDESGKVVGLGGVAFLPDGRKMLFSELTEDARKRPVALHRAAVRLLEKLKSEGITSLIATTSESGPEAAERWIRRLGFTFVLEQGGQKLWMWNADTVQTPS